MEFPILVFVYGTLKKGFGNHRVMERARGEYVGDTTIQHATMYSLGAFPAIALDKRAKTEVHGEVYRIADAEGLKPLDWLEGYPRFYNRSEVESPLGKVWVYHIDKSTLDESNRGIIEDGVWKR